MATELAAELPSAELIETAARPSRLPVQRVWSWLWPKLSAVVLMLAAWQAVVWSGWKPDYVLPGPGVVFQRLAQDLGNPNFDLGSSSTTRRGRMSCDTRVAR